MFSLLALALTLSLGSESRAFTIAKGLNSSDRREVTRTMGLNSAYKILTSPYPLGGFSGWEVGYSVEVIDVRELHEIGRADVTHESSWRYSRLTFGKGLYNNVDVFISFVPPTGDVPMSDFGGMVRWSVYQASYLPINMSILGHANQTSFANRFSNRNVGVEGNIGVTLENFAAYFGFGFLAAKAQFLGPDTNGVCNDDCTVDDGASVNYLTRSVSQSISATRSVVGFTYKYSRLFAAAEVSRVDRAVYSMKVGLRY